jgi:hypothetical protein
MSESITKLDLNFTNAGGGHTATVTSIQNPKKIQDGESLGIVIGELGEINDFSNDKISSMMSRFVCTQKTKSAGPTKKTITRRYVDRTSLLLESYIVLLRGTQLGPEGGSEFEGKVPFYSEVINSPLTAYKSMGPRINGSIIEIGRIYNAESGATPQGVKISLVYQRKELKKKLSLNTDFVSDIYEANPDLGQYDIKYGYTLDDFKTMLGQLGLSVVGLPENQLDEILFEASGSLSSVISSIAGYLGYFWYIHPENGSINFINTGQASLLSVEDFTNTSDSNIISASFTESNVFNKIVNSYSGTTETDQNKPDGDERQIPLVFKRVRFEKIKLPNGKRLEIANLSRSVLGAFYSIWDQGEDKNTFDIYASIIAVLADGNFRQQAGGQKVNLDRIFGDPPKGGSFTTLFNLFTNGKDANGNPVQIRPKKWADGSVRLVTFVPKLNPDDKDLSVFGPKGQNKKRCLQAARETDLRNGKNQRLNRKTDKFSYFNLKNQNGQNWPRPSNTELYSYLESYFRIAGGIYVSNAYSEYKADRMEIEGKAGLSIFGPFEGNKRLSEVDDLNMIFQYLQNIDDNLDPTIAQLAAHTQAKQKTIGPVIQVHDFYFVGLRQLPTIEKAKPVAGGKVNIKTPFRQLRSNFEFYEPAHKNMNLLGGPATAKLDGNRQKGLVSFVTGIMRRSMRYYIDAVKFKNTIKVKYKRSKTRMTKQDDETDQDEDDGIAGQTADGQKNSDLSDRYDAVFKAVEGPPHNILNKLSLSAASGSTAEMKVLQSMKGIYRDVFDKPKSSSRTLYGLHIPKFKVTMNSISISIGSSGITTTINESSIKLIPPDQNFLMTEGMEALTPKSTVPKSFSAGQRNVFGL